MARKETPIKKMVRLTARRFPSFGGGKIIAGHPIHLRNKPPQFAACVDIEQVVRFVLAKRNSIESARRKKNDPGNDARDIMNTAELLEPLSGEALKTIQKLKQNEIRQRLKAGIYPFSKLTKKVRESLFHLPISWIREGAEFKI